MTQNRRVIAVSARGPRKLPHLEWKPARRRFYATLGDRICNARLKLLMTQAELAKKVDLSRASIANIETGRQQMLLHTLADIAKVLKLDAKELLP